MTYYIDKSIKKSAVHKKHNYINIKISDASFLYA